MSVTLLGGFYAVFVEKVLRFQPDVKKLYLLIIGKDLFRALRDELGDHFGSFISEKVIAVAGDVSLENLGIKDVDLRKDMLEEIDIVLHSAASTKFDERFDVAMSTNTIGTSNVVNFAKNCTKFEIFIHVSTAYVCGESEGLIPEEPFQMGKTLNGFSKLDIDFEKKLVEKKLKELQTHNSNEETITSVMRSLGLERTIDSFATAYCKRKLSRFPGDIKGVKITSNRGTMVKFEITYHVSKVLDGLRLLRLVLRGVRMITEELH
ncbi:hypothetical protein L6164_026497 [Bauhinia variegata]|uniref:Uncharacterized protein n=1 Tax=Bauhinia variegata TaxID=167791 RepID=A0ACB9LR51_BAUVA|nr:hypothetical protein L6164_026497 [Bauhinia variegata]